MDKSYVLLLVVFLFSVGFILGAFVISVVWTSIADSGAYQEPEQVYLVTVDDITFTCTSKPIVKDEYISIKYCKETFGGIVRVQSYQTYSVKERE